MLELLLRLVVSLAVVVGLLLLVVRFGARRFKGGSDALVQVVHRQPLSRTTAVAVVAVGSRILVLGTTESHVSVLTELDPIELDAGEVVLDSFDLAGVAAPAPVGVPAPQPVQPAVPVVEVRPVARVADRPPTEQPVTAGRPRPAARPSAVPPVEVPLTEVAAALTVLAAEQPASQPASQPALDLAPVAVPEAPAAALALIEAENQQAIQAVTALSSRRPVAVPGSGALAGSVLSPQTWKQAFSAATRGSKKAS